MEKEKRQIIVLSQFLFDEKMDNDGINDSNIEELTDTAFISIIGTPQVLSEYLKEENTVHWFKENHHNVLNLEFDDVDHDLQFANCEFKAITPSQSEEIVKFIEANLGKNFIIHCRAGMSRSQAVGCFLYDFYKEYFSESQPYLKRDFANKGVTRELKRILFQNI